MSSYFPMTTSMKQYVHRQETIDTSVPLPDGEPSDKKSRFVNLRENRTRYQNHFDE